MCHIYRTISNIGVSRWSRQKLPNNLYFLYTQTQFSLFGFWSLSCHLHLAKVNMSLITDTCNLYNNYEHIYRSRGDVVVRDDRSVSALKVSVLWFLKQLTLGLDMRTDNILTTLHPPFPHRKNSLTPNYQQSNYGTLWVSQPSLINSKHLNHTLFLNTYLEYEVYSEQQ